MLQKSNVSEYVCIIDIINSYEKCRSDLEISLATSFTSSQACSSLQCPPQICLHSFPIPLALPKPSPHIQNGHMDKGSMQLPRVELGLKARKRDGRPSIQRQKTYGFKNILLISKNIWWLKYSKLHATLISGIVPRPVAFVSTISEDGTENIAPFRWRFFLIIERDILAWLIYMLSTSVSLIRLVIKPPLVTR